MWNLAVGRLALWILELEYFLIDTQNDSLVKSLLRERKEHLNKIRWARNHHDPQNHRWVVDALDECYANLARIEDILDHKFRYKCPHTGYDFQFAWWKLRGS
jgi:hypothetical protein